MNLLVTGGAGFIGSNFVRLALQEGIAANITVLDALTYAGNRSTMTDWAERVHFVEGRIEDAVLIRATLENQNITHVVNFAAETHNDRSLDGTSAFITTNTLGIHNLLTQVRESGAEKVVHVSTDEVYGTISDGAFTETSPLQPNTPYSASKAGGDLQCRAHFHSYQTPVCVTRGGNTYGPYQYPEKLISFFTVRLLDGKKVPLYGDGSQIREWIHVEDHCRGVLTVLQSGVPGEIYNIGDSNERTNRWITDRLLDLTQRDESLVKCIEDPRKGAHDFRYSMTCESLQRLGWKPIKNFEAELEATVRWYQSHESWWREVSAKPAYQEFVRRFYGPGLGEDL